MAKHPLTLGGGNDPTLTSVEKGLSPTIRFKLGADIGEITFNGADWDVSLNGSPIGSIPGSGGGVPTSRVLTAGTGLTGGGDLTADRTFALANTAVTPGAYGAPFETTTFTVDAQGRLTAAAAVSIGIDASQVTGGQFGTGRIADDAITAAKLADTAVTPGAYGGSAAQTVSFTVDAQGRLTAAGVNTITIDASQVGSGTFGTSLITDDAITNGKLRDSAALSVIGRSANSTGDPADIAAGTTGHVLRRSGTTLAFGTLEAGAFVSNTVSRAALANGTALTVIGRSANSTGAVADIAASADGNVLRRSGTTLGFGAIALASSNAVSGQLGRANGGLGVDASGWTTGNYPAANGSGGFNQRSPAQVITDGAAAVPTWTGQHTFNAVTKSAGNQCAFRELNTGTTTLAITDEYVYLQTFGANVTANLPASPVQGQRYCFTHLGVNTATIGRNGNTIDGVASDIVLAAGTRVTLVWSGGSWLRFGS